MALTKKFQEMKIKMLKSEWDFLDMQKSNFDIEQRKHVRKLRQPERCFNLNKRRVQFEEWRFQM